MLRDTSGGEDVSAYDAPSPSEPEPLWVDPSVPVVSSDEESAELGMGPTNVAGSISSQVVGAGCPDEGPLLGVVAG